MIGGESMNLREINKTLTVARHNGFKFNQINKVTMKTFSFLSHINIHYYLKHRIPILLRHFFKKLYQNPENVQAHCDDWRTFFHFACFDWFSHNNPQCCYSIITPVQILVQIGKITPIQIFLFL